MHALTFEAFGEADVLRWVEMPTPSLSEGSALVRTEAIGLNFADVYRRRGTYHLAGAPPYIAGYEAAGVVVEVAPLEYERQGLTYTPAVGDRVGFADVPFSNAEFVASPFEKLVPLPDSISAKQAASVLLQGLTAHFLTHDSHQVRSGETVLVHAAAGGVGQLVTQLAASVGARVLGLASTEEKRAAVLGLGAERVASTRDDWVSIARAFGGDGVDVGYDSVGTTLAQTLEAVRIGGHVVFYGMAGGDPALVDPRRLMDESKSLTGGDLWNVLATQQDRIDRANALFARMERGELAVRIAREFALRDGVEAHRFIESRQAIGKVLLLPNC